MTAPNPAVSAAESAVLPRGFLTSGFGSFSAGGGYAVILMPPNREAAVDRRISAAVVTQHPFAAPSVRRIAANPTGFRCVAINSRNANAGNGERGYRDNETAAIMVAHALRAYGYDVPANQVATLSTGSIGYPLDMTSYEVGIDLATGMFSTSSRSVQDAARAILTTDSLPKISTTTSGPVRMTAVAKGSAMISPALATMLVVVITDAVVDSETLQSSLQTQARRMLNRIEIDGTTSTNDAVTVLASGASGQILTRDQLDGMFQQVLGDVAHQLFDDAETSVTRGRRSRLAPPDAYSRRITVSVTGATSVLAADSVARSVVNTPLLRSALATDENLYVGLLFAAAGSALLGTTELDHLRDFSISLNGRPVCTDDEILVTSVPMSTDDDTEVLCEINLGNGPGFGAAEAHGVITLGHMLV